MNGGNGQWISVVIPTFNRANRLLNAIDSVKNQCFRPVEIVVVDDGSSDNTSDVLSAWTNKNQSETLRVSYFTQSNSGAPAARNFGWKESRGDYIHFLDSDDILLPGCLKMKLNALVRNNASYAYGYSRIKDEFGHTIGMHGHDITRTAVSAYIIPYSFNTSGPLLRRSVLESLGGWNERLVGCQEIELFFRLKKDFGRGVCLPLVLHQVNKHTEDSISQRATKLHGEAALGVLNEMVISMKELKDTFGTEHCTNEFEALATFALDVCSRNYQIQNLPNALDALAIAQGSTSKRLKRIVLTLGLIISYVVPKAGVGLIMFLRTSVSTPQDWNTTQMSRGEASEGELYDAKSN